MIGRIWHGYTTPGYAEAYQNILLTEVIPGIAAMNIKGYRKIQVIRRGLPDEVEFITIMWFDALENVKAFMGDDYEVAHVPQRAREVLKRFDDRSQHYELIEELEY
jgi:antibiotic biosynthesis monooxygenase (ABM) superfamily enzyme